MKGVSGAGILTTAGDKRQRLQGDCCVCMSVSAPVTNLVARSALLLAWKSAFQSYVAQEASQAMLWSPVLFAIGIGVYFRLPMEPGILVPGVITSLAMAGTIAARHHPGIRRFCAVIVLCAAGFGVAGLRTAALDTELLPAETGPLTLEATVSNVEVRPDGTRRLTLEDVFPESSAASVPEKVRLTVRTRVGPLQPGDQVRTRAVLMPPSGPAIPGGFDFARQAWFDGLGAVGYTISPVEAIARPASAGGSFVAFIMGLRISISDRIRQHLDEPAAGIAIALMTGRREAISEETYGVFRDSGIAHILALSGLHMGLVAGLLFFTVRALFAMSEKAAIHYPIKKWAAAITLLGCFMYLFIGGMSVSIQRAFIMTGFVLIAIMADRTAISMHRVAWAALLVLIFAPESLLEAGFQMSFSAVIALIAFYERFGAKILQRARAMPLHRKVGFYLLGIVLTTVVSDAATAPFAAYHFNRVAGLGLITNLFAVPLVGGWIMPCALAAYFLMPFGLEWLALVPMGWGIDIMFVGASYVAAQPSSVFLVPAIPPAAFLLFVFGGLWLCLWRQSWRRLGILAMGLAALLAWNEDHPDILVTDEGNLAAIRLESGELSFSSSRGAGYVREKWLQRHGQSNMPVWADAVSQSQNGPTCDSLSCTMRKSGLQTVFARDARALSEDCLKADILIAGFPVLAACDGPRHVIDLWDLRAGGTHAIYFDEDDVRIVRTEQERGNRPWTQSRGSSTGDRAPQDVPES